MRTLVTGANGMIGRHLVRRLAERGDEVRAMIRPGRAPDPLIAQCAGFVHGDVTSPTDVERCVSGCERVFHLAKVSHGADPAEIWRPNVDGAILIAEAALRSGVRRLIFTSSAAVYGRSVSRRMLTEESAPRPDSLYGKSKLAAETALLGAHERGLPVVIVRTGVVLGPGSLNWLDLARRLADGRFRMAGRGAGLHALTDVEDFLDGLLLAADTPGVEGQAFILTGAEPVTLRAWMQAMCEPGGQPLHDGWPEPLIRLYGAGDRLAMIMTGHRLPMADRLDLFLGDRSFDISKARRILGFAPRIDGLDAARRLVSWYRQEGLLPG